MIGVHTVFDLVEFFGTGPSSYPPLFLAVSRWGSLAFLLLSGICVSFGSHPLRRGLTVLCCGIGITAVTLGLHLLGLLDQRYIIWFGTLHCLGVSMLLWPLLRRSPSGPLVLLGAAVILSGIAAARQTLSFPWLIPLGFTTAEFSSGDYFPLLPCFGFFLLGAVLGRRLYPEKKSLFPKNASGRGIFRPLCFVGRHSLWFYLAHQPVITGLLAAARGIAHSF